MNNVKVNSALLRANFALLSAKCGAAKIYGLRLGFSNSNISSHITSLLFCHTSEAILETHFFIKEKWPKREQ